MTPAGQAFYDACCAGKEWDVLISLALDMTDADIASYPFPDLARGVRSDGEQYDPYRWRSIQPQIDKEIAALREGVRDHYAWRRPFGD